jgi:hypothetical protein
MANQEDALHEGKELVGAFLQPVCDSPHQSSDEGERLAKEVGHGLRSKDHEEKAYHHKRDDDERTSVDGEWEHLSASFEGVVNDFDGAESVNVIGTAPELAQMHP